MEKIKSDINIIDGISNCSLIEAALEHFTKRKGQLDLKELVVTNKTFDFRTESAFKRFLAAVSIISYDVLSAGQLKKYLNADW